MFYELKIMENNIVFQMMHHNFHIRQFVEIGLHLSESLINYASGDMQDFLQRPMEKRRESLYSELI